MNTRYLLLVFFLLLFSKQEINAQFGFSHEVGVITGPITFYSDYGVRNDFETNIGNVGFGVGLIHYLNFSYRADCNCYTRDKYFNDHFKVRTELDFHKTNFDHFGKWVDPDKTSPEANYLRATNGSTTVFDIGAQLEYFPLSIRDFSARPGSIAPFVSLGIHWVSFDPEFFEPNVLDPQISRPPKYINAYQSEADSTFSLVTSFGLRYKLTHLTDLMIDSRWQYYFSNWVDGLNPSFENNGFVEVPENKANDWIYWLNIGFIYYID